MTSLGHAFLRGLGVVLPIGVTVYLMYALGLAAESAARHILLLLLPADWYAPGVGLLVVVLIIFAVGLLVKIPGMGIMVYLAEWVFNRLPVVRSVYSMLKDFVGFMSSSSKSGGGRPVLVTLAPDVEVVGLLTNDSPEPLDGGDGQVYVFLPMSYQIGGYSVLVPRAAIKPLGMSMEDAMSFVVTAGVNKAISQS